MTEILSAAGAVVVLLALVWLVMSTQRRSSAVNEPYHVWAVTRANTSDGVTAHLEVEVLVDLLGESVDRSSADGDLIDAVENELRRRITAHPVASLPSVGDDTPFIHEDVLPGHRVLRGVVTISDVEVTPELRRLVTDRCAP